MPELRSRDELRLLHIRKCLLVLQIFRSSGLPELVEEADSKELSAIWKLPPDALGSLYVSILEVLEEASHMETIDDARQHRQARLLQAWNNVSNAGVSSKEGVSGEALPGSFTAGRLAPLEFNVVSAEPRWKPSPIEVKDSEETDALKRVDPCYSRSGAEDVLRYILGTRMAGSKGKSSCTLGSSPSMVRVLLGGGNGSIHYALLGYVNLVAAGVVAGGTPITNSPGPALDMEFCILPVGETNSLATYIAQRDLWYDSTVYKAVMNKLPLVPHIAPPDSKARSSSRSRRSLECSSDATPSWVLSRQVENYVLEANCCLKVAVFNCDAWFQQEKNRGRKKLFCTIPFCVRADIGVQVVAASQRNRINAQQQQHQQCVPRPSISRARNLEDDLLFHHSTRVKVCYKQVGYDGEEDKAEVCQLVTLGAVMVINVPQASEARLCCEPSDELLSVCVLDAEKARRKRVRAVEEMVLHSTTLKARSVVVQSADANKAFDVALDGEVYGPFYRIRLTACRHPLSKDVVLSLPVATYWPTGVSRHSV